MNGMRMTLTALGVLGLAAILASGRPAAAQTEQKAEEPPSAGREKTETVTTDATVDAVDKKTRTVRVTDQEGKSLEVFVPKDVKGLDKVKPGDAITLRHTQSMVLKMVPPEEGETGTKKTQIRLPDGASAQQVVTTVEIVRADTQNNAVQYLTSDGKSHVAKVRDPQMQRTLRELKPGDRVQVTYTESTAAEILPKAKK